MVFEAKLLLHNYQFSEDCSWCSLWYSDSKVKRNKGAGQPIVSDQNKVATAQHPHSFTR